MRLFATIFFAHLLQHVYCKEPPKAFGEQPSKVLHALPEFVSGKTLSALKDSVVDQFEEEAAQERCLPSSCVLPEAKVIAAVGEKLRQALAFVESTQTIHEYKPVEVPEGKTVYLPALRTEPDGQGEADFHDDFDVDDPQKEAIWTALLYLDASSGDRFMVRLRNNSQHIESQEIAPGTLILFKSSEVQHTAKGTAKESRRLALGPVALDQRSRGSEKTGPPDSFRARILGWGGGSSGGSGGGSGDSDTSNTGRCHVWLAVVGVLLAMGSRAY